MSVGDLARGAPRTSARRRRVNQPRRDELLERVEEAILAGGFTSLTMEDLSRQMSCSKATLYNLAPTKEQLVIRVTKRFFARAADEIEAAVAAQSQPDDQIATYLNGVGTAMRQQSPAFYDDMVRYEPTAQIYRHNSETAARRLGELMADGIAGGVFRSVDGTFAAQVIALAIDGIQSGTLLATTGISVGDAFSELGDLILNGLRSHRP